MAAQVTPPTVFKDPSAFLAYGFDLSVPYTPQGKPYLAAGETVTALSVTSDPGITVVSSGIFNNPAGIPTQVAAWISGGALGNQYQVHFLFTTSQGNQDSRTLTLSMVQK
jgi:hypothetical protein